MSIITGGESHRKGQVGSLLKLMKCYEQCVLTARQLREFALPGAAIRLIVPVARMKLSRWQAGMARYLQSRVRLVLRSRYMTFVYK